MKSRHRGISMFRIASSIFFALILFTSIASSGDDKKGDKLQGAWTATSWQRGDGVVDKDKLATELVISKDKYEFPKGINRISKGGTFKHDAAKGTIDFTPDDGPAKGKTLLGIFKVEGDTLTFCFRPAGSERPTEFKSADRNTVLATYVKKK